MNRRDFLQGSGVALGYTTFTSAGSALAQSQQTVICHVIRLKLSSKISVEDRRKTVATIHRFKQIKSPELFVVGRDVSMPGSDGFDYTHISLFQNENGFRDYFYDPIHLAADREVWGATVVERGSSFDAVQGGSDDLPKLLPKILLERKAKFEANDTRPTTPPVADRPQDLRWSHGSQIYRLVKFEFGALNVAQRAQRLVSIERCGEVAGVKVLMAGRHSTRRADDLTTHDMLLQVADEAAYWRYMSSPRREVAERIDDGAKVTWFNVIDDNDAGLARRLMEGKV